MYMFTRMLSYPLDPPYYTPSSSLRPPPPAFIHPFSADFPCSLIRADALSPSLPFVLRVFDFSSLENCT